MRERTSLRPGAACTFVVLPRGASPGVNHYVELHKNKFPIKQKKTINLDKLEWIGQGPSFHTAIKPQLD